MTAPIGRRIRHDVAMPTVAALIVAALCLQVVLATAVFRRVDAGLRLWHCHAAVGYGHPAELDTCLNRT